MHSAFILVSDRVSNGEKQDKITPIVGERLAAAGAPVASAVTIPEGFDTVSEAPSPGRWGPRDPHRRRNWA